LSSKSFRVVFTDVSLEEDLVRLESGSFEERRMTGWIRKAISRLSENPKVGIKVPSKYWPEAYIQKYQIDNLWKVNLPMGWRMMYTLSEHELEVLGVILEWFNHVHYARRHGY
jgi:hypothetical protein